MKKSLYSAIAALLIFAFTACSDDPGPKLIDKRTEDFDRLLYDLGDYDLATKSEGKLEIRYQGTEDFEWEGAIYTKINYGHNFIDLIIIPDGYKKGCYSVYNIGPPTYKTELLKHCSYFTKNDNVDVVEYRGQQYGNRVLDTIYTFRNGDFVDYPVWKYKGINIGTSILLDTTNYSLIADGVIATSYNLLRENYFLKKP